jgi:OFA family oxalate/formate antiporter-like MFS transporter
MNRKQGQNPTPWLASRLPFYYGWLIVPVVIIAQGVSGVGQTYGLSVFNPSLHDSLGISLSVLSITYMIGTLVASLPQPYIGSVMDRFGIRWTTIGIGILLGGACLLFSQVNSIITLLLGFFLLRLLGQGALSLLAGNMPAMWFQEKLGTVAGIVSSGFPISIAVIPPFFLYLINQMGWRSAYQFLGILVWLILLPLMVFVYKNHPADVGQVMDGGIDLEGKRRERLKNRAISFTPEQARRTSSYWIALVNNALWAMIITAVFFNLLFILDSQGITPAVAAATYTTIAVASIATQLMLGPLANKGPLQILLMASMAALAGGIIALIFSTTPLIAHLYAVITGISTGLISLVGGTLLPRYFGREHLGKLRGAVLTAQMAGSSLGPFITGLIFDLTGSFQISLWIFVGLLIPAALISLRATQPPQLVLEREGR